MSNILNKNLTKEFTDISPDILLDDVSDENPNMLPMAPCQIKNIKGKEISKKDTLVDLEYSRKVLQQLTERAQQLSELAIQCATDSLSPRSIEVATMAINNVSEQIKNLLGVNEKARELLNEENPPVINNTQNIFMTTNDVLDNFLNKKGKHKKTKVIDIETGNANE